MKVKVQIVVEYNEDDAPIVEEVACLCRDDLRPETLGLTLEEGKQLLTRVQEIMVTHQATEYVEQHRACPHCQKRRSNKGKHEKENLMADKRPGRKIEVEFKDGEKVKAYCESYHPTRQGFIIFPMDVDSNNEKIFVVNEAVKTANFID